jgi:ER lumen protein retaining receptor
MRYLDLATTYISLYNTSLKVFYILGSLSAALAIYLILRETYEDKLDTFR